jgi:hypothetical protein
MDEEGKKKANKLLDEIQRRDMNHYMDVCYDTVIKFPDQLIEHTESTLAQKLESMDLMITHFAERDEFEKCGVLVGLKIKIEEEHD